MNAVLSDPQAGAQVLGARVLLMLPFWLKDSESVHLGDRIQSAPFTDAQTHELLPAIRQQLVGSTKAYLFDSTPLGLPDTTAKEAILYLSRDAGVVGVSFDLAPSSGLTPEKLQQYVSDLTISGWDGAIRKWADEQLGHTAREWRDGHPLVFVTALFRETVHLTDPNQRALLSRPLFGTVRLHPVGHAGWQMGADEPPQATLNANHWTAATPYASVHYISQQGNGHPFDADRLARITRRYSFVYLLMVLQRLRIERLLADVARIASEAKLSVEKISAVRESLARYQAGESASQLSSRDELQRYADLVRKAFRLEDLLADANRAIKDFEAWVATREQAHLSKAAHRLEYLVMAVTMVEITHTFYDIVHDSSWVLLGLAIVASIVGAGVVYSLDKRKG